MKYKLSHKLSVIFLKYIVVIGALIMYIHNILLINHTELKIADWSISLPILPYITAITWSYALDFCNIHRLCLTYICAMTYCIKFQAEIGFGEYLFPARMAMFVFGTLVFMGLFIHLKHNKNK